MGKFIGMAELEQAIGWDRDAIYRAVHAEPPLPHYRLTARSHIRFVLVEVQDFLKAAHNKPAAAPRKRRRIGMSRETIETLRSQGFDL